MFDLKENEDGFYFMSNRGKRGNDDDVEDLLKKFLVNRPHSLFLYRPDVSDQVAKRDSLPRPNR